MRFEGIRGFFKPVLQSIATAARERWIAIKILIIIFLFLKLKNKDFFLIE